MKSTTEPRRNERLGLYVLTHTSRYLEQCLQSVMAQSVAPTEVLVVDNGSPQDEGVCGIAARFGFPSVRIGQAISPPAARNVACSVLEHCDLVVNLDGDDLILETYIEKYWRRARSHNADVVFGAAELFGSESGIEFSRAQLGSRPDLRRGNFVPMNSLFRRNLWRDAGGFDSSIGLYDDYDFWLSLAERDACFSLIDEPLWRYRKHPSSRMTTPDMETRVLSRRLIREKHHRYVNGTLQWRRIRRNLSKVTGAQLSSRFRLRARDAH
jgi:glycosyltransferase involved in cell wall biosynthesis